jgi:hypothetical protein
MSRYSRIRQAAQLQLALTALRAYDDTPRTPQLNTRGAQGPFTNVYVNPFGFDIETDEVIRVRNNAPAYTALATAINTTDTGAEVTNALGSKTVAIRGGFSAARIIWFRNATRSVTTPRSAVTNLQYLKYAGDRSSCAFGRKAATDNMHDAFSQIKGVLLTSNAGLAVNRVTLQPERVRYGA